MSLHNSLIDNTDANNMITLMITLFILLRSPIPNDDDDDNDDNDDNDDDDDDDNGT